MIKKISLVILTVFFLLAGFNHFWHPEDYYGLIPPYIPAHRFINMASGVLEILLGILLVFPGTRKPGAFGIIFLLILFIPAHIYMIQLKGCVGPEICVPEWVAWLRLFPGQFLLISWARWHAK
ncbi:hypothetical protein QWZ08_23825 [Ferruginibacter paludis]|uniref:DoxX family protein n=1 Tax=Ferruginibacter paludis TaxID=1310417 RepID=UPI0025B49AAB|nr:MauE/DoxX family redox-associated membrane protein [Ferruginibacter paludis]MDN3658693.1 hypothetical protein [Ferruginibacter paludis]